MQSNYSHNARDLGAVSTTERKKSFPSPTLHLAPVLEFASSASPAAPPSWGRRRHAPRLAINCAARFSSYTDSGAVVAAGVDSAMSMVDASSLLLRWHDARAGDASTVATSPRETSSGGLDEEAVIVVCTQGPGSELQRRIWGQRLLSAAPADLGGNADLAL